jgi:tRNA 2-thiouridine synthesizing protein A
MYRKILHRAGNLSLEARGFKAVISRPMSTTELDVKGLNCPLPVLRVKKAMAGLPAGATLKVFATDPGAVKDFEAFCKTSGNIFKSASEADGVFVFEIGKAG